MNICPADVSKHNPKEEKEVILLMILNREGWHYLAVKNFSVLLKGKTLWHDGEFFIVLIVFIISGQTTGMNH